MYSLLIQLFLLTTHYATHQIAASDNECLFGFHTCGNTKSILGKQIPVPCRYSGKPQVVDDLELLKQFDELCPSLNVVKKQQDGLCCSVEQLHQYLDSMKQAKSILGSCPSCLINFSQFFCDLTCSPKQASFVEVLKTSPYQSQGETYERIETIGYTVNEDFVQGLYDSCKNVHWLALRIKALNVICGIPCSPKKLAERLGKRGNGPFDIEFTYTDDQINQFKPLSCNSSVSDYYDRFKNSSSFYNSPCSSTDCPSDAANDK